MSSLALLRHKNQPRSFPVTGNRTTRLGTLEKYQQHFYPEYAQMISMPLAEHSAQVLLCEEEGYAMLSLHLSSTY